MQLYRKGSFGKLAEFFVLDTRQYRTDQPNNDRKSPLNEAAFNPRNTMFGQWVRSFLPSANWILSTRDKNLFMATIISLRANMAPGQK